VDPFSQAVLGAALAQGVARPAEARGAALAGVIGGVLADGDVLVRSAEDPLLLLDAHRHITHALVVAPLGALLVAGLAALLLRGRIAFSRLYLFSLLSYLSAVLLDVFTSYGTSTLWPFSDARLAWDWISVIDPLFTLPILVLALWAFVRRSPALGRAGVVVAVAYLALGGLQHQRALELAGSVAAERGHTPTAMRVMPSLGNLLLWRSVYAHDGVYTVDALRLGPPGETRVYPGGSVPQLAVTRDLPGLAPGSVQARDLARFRRFAQGWLFPIPGEPGRVGDLRYARLPDSLRPLWAIELDAATPEHHVTLIERHDPGPGEWDRLLAQLAGRAAP